MELQFQKDICTCLNPVTDGVRSQEQTQEVKLPDNMPDVGRVLASWGQCLLRSKEWRSNGMNISSGVMTWTLYAPEDGAEPVCVEAWIPLHSRWDFPEQQRDGIIRTVCCLQSVDARALSARRLLVRVNVNVWAEAMEPSDREIMTGGEVPEDIQLLRRTYPMMLSREAGEKTFLLEDEIPVSSMGTIPKKIISYQLQPEILDKKVMGERIVFRGNGKIHLVFRNDDGRIHCKDMEIPFSQLAELEREYGSDTETEILPSVTSLELDLDEDHLNIKCGITAQYMIKERKMVDLVQDAYSPRRKLTPTVKELNLPLVLDHRKETCQSEIRIQAEAEDLADVICCLEFPRINRNGEAADAEISGILQVLFYDTDGQLQCENRRFEEKLQILVSDDAKMKALITDSVIQQSMISGTGIQAKINVTADMTTFSDCGLPMITALETGEMEEPDPGRPSLILRRVGEEPLWDIAKACGSTVDAIKLANNLQNEPENGRILLIPIP